MDIEFTDRYGPQGAPSWLRGCHDQCEAMGYVPIFKSIREPGVNEATVESETSPGYLRAWFQAHAQPHAEECDGWHFVQCGSCNGTGRVSMWRSLARIPRWFVRGAKFLLEMGPNHSVRPPYMNGRQHWWLVFKCAYLYDLGWKK